MKAKQKKNLNEKFLRFKFIVRKTFLSVWNLIVQRESSENVVQLKYFIL